MWRQKLILLEDQVCLARPGNLVRGKEVCVPAFPHRFSAGPNWLRTVGEKLAHDNQAARPDDRALGRVALHSSSGYGVHDIGTNLSNVRSSHSVDRSGPDSFTI
jgi:hypothetical protein